MQYFEAIIHGIGNLQGGTRYGSSIGSLESTPANVPRSTASAAFGRQFSIQTMRAAKRATQLWIAGCDELFIL